MNPSISIQIQDVMGHVENFNNLKALEKFLDHEKTFWATKTSEISQHSYFIQNNRLNAVYQRLGILYSNIEKADEAAFNQHLSALRSSDLPNFQAYWLLSKHGLKLISLMKLQERDLLNILKQNKPQI